VSPIAEIRLTVAGAPSLREQILNLDRQFTHTDTCRMVHRRGHGGGEAGEADLADPPRA
jgi:hypothetical protein